MARRPLSPAGVFLWLALLLACAVRPSRAPAQGTYPISFAPPQVIPVSADGTGPAVADFDGDGKLDIAVAGASGNISILYGRGDGTFEPPVIWNAPGQLSALTAADVNGDGFADLVAAWPDGNQVVVLLNLGGRAFGIASGYAVGTKPYGVAAADFNGDRMLDLAVSNDNSNDVTILLNQGNGTFHATATYGAGSFPSRVAAADFNRDGHIDLVVGNYVSASLDIYLGNGDGTFRHTGSLTVGSYPTEVLVADLNKDGKLDLASANAFDHTVSVLFGDGAGGFSPQVAYGGTHFPQELHAPDLDGDGWPDLVVSNSDNYISVFRGAGAGAFQTFITFETGGTDSTGLEVADFNGDGAPDVVTANSGSQSISILLNNTRFPPPSNLTATARSTAEIDLQWQNNASNATSVLIQRRTPAGDYADLATVPATAASYSDSGLPAGATFLYRLQAISGALVSNYSNEAAATTPTATYTISGTVQQGTTGLPGVTVSAGSASVTTDANGNYSISGLVSGSYTIAPSLAEYTFSPANAPVTVGPDQGGVNFAATRNTYQIAGTVTVNGSGLAGVTVTAGSTSATTDASGSYTLVGLVNGTYSVTPSLTGYTYFPSSQAVSVGPSQSGVDFTAATIPTYAIRGRVTRSGNGLAGVAVSAGAQSALTAKDGTYAISGLTVDLYQVTPSLAGYNFVPASRPVRVGPDVSGINFTAKALPPPPKLRSLVLRPTSARQGKTVTGTVALTGATRSPVDVALSTTSAAVPVPGTVTVPVGKSSVSFSFTVGNVAKRTAAMVTASYNGLKKSVTVTVTP